MTKILFASALPLLALSLTPAHAAVSVDSVGFSYNQNFDTLSTSTTATTWVNDSTLPGWSLLTSTLAAAPTILGGNGSANSGSFYSFGATGSGERALGGTASGGTYFGSPASGTVAGYIVVAFTNDSGSALDGFSISFNGEQWRNGGNTSAQPMVMEFGLGASFGTVATWVAPASLSWNSPVVGATAAAVDGNAAGLVTGLSATVGSLGWAAGDTLWMRWTERNDLGNDHGLAIDDLSFSVSAVPEPGALALLLAGLATVGFVARRRA
jgi:hypothetical protein